MDKCYYYPFLAFSHFLSPFNSRLPLSSHSTVLPFSRFPHTVNTHTQFIHASSYSLSFIIYHTCFHFFFSHCVLPSHIYITSPYAYSSLSLSLTFSLNSIFFSCQLILPPPISLPSPPFSPFPSLSIFRHTYYPSLLLRQRILPPHFYHSPYLSPSLPPPRISHLFSSHSCSLPPHLSLVTLTPSLFLRSAWSG